MTAIPGRSQRTATWMLSGLLLVSWSAAGCTATARDGSTAMTGPHMAHSSGAGAERRAEGDRRRGQEPEREELQTCEPGDDDCAAGLIGPAGGRLAYGGVTLEIPPGALDVPTLISFAHAPGAATPGVTPLGPVWRFLPEGTLFAKPVRVTFTLPTGVADASVYWSRLGASGFDPLGGSLAGRRLTVETPHFSLAVLGPPSTTRTVVGSRVVTYISAWSRVSEPNPVGDAVEVLIPDGLGGYAALPATFGTGTAAGIFTVSGVPQGEYLLHAGDQYLLTSSSAPDLGWTAGGTRSPPPVWADPNLTTLLDVTMSNLAPWQDGDQLEMINSSSDTWDFRIEQNWATLAPGDTSTRFTADVASLYGGAQPSYLACDGTVQTQTIWARLSQAVSGGGAGYVHMTAAAPTCTTTVPNATTLVDVSLPDNLAATAVERTIDVDLRGSAFRAALLQDGNPGQTFVAWPDQPDYFAVLGQAGLPSDGFYDSNADLLVLANPAAADLRSGAMGYFTSEPPPGTSSGFLGGRWGDLASVRANAFVYSAIPGLLPVAYPFNSFIQWTGTPADLAVPAVLTPPLTLPVAATVTGPGGTFGLFEDATGVGLTPTLAWSPPRVGVPDAYTLTIFRLRASANGRRTQRAGNVTSLVTPHTSLTLPPGLLTAGEFYVFSLTAAKLGNPSAPFRNGTGDVLARVISGTFSP
jgi:hypothetical protein